MSDIAISSRSCTERHGDFFESVVFHSSYEVSCFLLVVCLFFGWAVWFVLAVCLCWLLLFGWMGDTLGIVSLYSHAWEWTISTNGLMTVRASSAHGTRKKKKGQEHKEKTGEQRIPQQRTRCGELSRPSDSEVLEERKRKRP